MTVYEKRRYREYTKAEGLAKFEVIFKETNLLVMAEKNICDQALAAAEKYYNQIEQYIKNHPHFQKSFKPVLINPFSPRIIWNMAWAAWRCRVGPMASVAGAVSEMVGYELASLSKEMIIENGGDNYLKSAKPRKVGVFAGASPLSEKIAIEIEPDDMPCGVCTSSGTVGPSFSFGKADAVCVVAKSAALADAAATAIGNAVHDVNTIHHGLEVAKKISDLTGVLIIKDDRMGIMGKIKIVPM
jgi:uncharacterized protein